jgi:hypothetical protein
MCAQWCLPSPSFPDDGDREGFQNFLELQTDAVSCQRKFYAMFVVCELLNTLYFCRKIKF